MLWDYVSIMGTDTDWNHKPISIDFYGYFAPRKSCGNYSAPPMGMSNRLTVVLQQELH